MTGSDPGNTDMRPALPASALRRVRRRADSLVRAMLRLTLATALLVPGALVIGGSPREAVAAPGDAGITYDIVYVRYPRDGNTTVVNMPQGEIPDAIEAGADLVLLHPNGSEEILVGCRDPSGYASNAAEAGDVSVDGTPATSWPACSVQDPVVSFDGQWVYYAKYVNVNDLYTVLTTDAYLFKMQIGGSSPQKSEIQLTDGSTRFEHDRFAGNTFPTDDIPYGVRDLGPTLLPNGDIVFTSNRPGEVPPRQGSQGGKGNPWRMLTTRLYRMGDHDGSQPNKDLREIGHANLHLAQHPFVLKDGRIVFSTWDDSGVKTKYALTTLYAIHPDGSNLEMFMEPHDFHKRLDHFATETGGGNVVVTSYYPGNLWGFGLLFRMPVEISGPDFQQAQLPDEDHYRPFARRGTVNMTPHTGGADQAAPGDSGRYSTPSAAPGGNLLVAYSPGPVSGGGPHGTQNPLLDSGLYLIANADTAYITDPTTQLVNLKNASSFNELWPRAVTPYTNVHGTARPVTISDNLDQGTLDSRLPKGTPFALFGTSSIYNRESAPLNGDPFWQNDKRELTAGTWTVQGAQAGVFTNSQIYGVRILASVPKPFHDVYLITPEEERLLHDSRMDKHVEGYTSHSFERWKILGEFPVKKTDGSGNVICNSAERLLARDADGLINPSSLYVSSPSGPCGLYSPDTSFLALLPADTPFFVQGIDQNGMTLFSEQTWRTVVPGEKRTNCDGCHGHSIPGVPFEGTEASDPGYAVWDIARKTPYITADGSGNPTVAYRTDGGGNDVGLWDIEFNRDVKPILDAKCVSCHDASNNTTGTDLVFNDPTDTAYWRLAKDSGGKYGGSIPNGKTTYNEPQESKYIRAFQARQSLLIWKLFGQRLDGRANGTRTDDLDYTGQAMPPPGSPQLTDEEKRLIARWVDLGAPLDLSRPENRYTDDDLLPVLAVAEPTRGMNPNTWNRVTIGAYDLESGVNPASLNVTLSFGVGGLGAGSNLASLASFDAANSVWTIDIPAGSSPGSTEAALNVSVADNEGNTYRQSVHFKVGTGSIAAPQNVTVTLSP